jgi:hypothetical protein
MSFFGWLFIIAAIAVLFGVGTLVKIAGLMLLLTVPSVVVMVIIIAFLI